MTLQPKELWGPEVAQTQALRAFPSANGIYPGTLAQQGSATAMPNLTPLYIDNTTKTWKVWVGETDEINTITAHAATPATAGDFTLTVNGVTSAPIAFNATAAIIQAALEAMSNIAPGDVTAVATTGANLGVASAVVTLNWGGTLAGQDITITADFTGISAGSDPVLATSQAGDATQTGDVINGFLWAPDEAFVPSTTGEVTIQVFRRGVIHFDDIPLPSGTSRIDLGEMLLASSMREQGIDIQGLVGIG
jgi:hypothetical protein